MSAMLPPAEIHKLLASHRKHHPKTKSNLKTKENIIQKDRLRNTPWSFLSLQPIMTPFAFWSGIREKESWQILPSPTLNKKDLDVISKPRLVQQGLRDPST